MNWVYYAEECAFMLFTCLCLHVSVYIFMFTCLCLHVVYMFMFTGAIDELGAMPYYAEECASMLAVTFSSGGARTRNIVSICYREFDACTVDYG